MGHYLQGFLLHRFYLQIMKLDQCLPDENLQKVVAESKKEKKLHVYSLKTQAELSRSALSNGPTAAAKRFQGFRSVNESTVRTQMIVQY